ncbi:MAG: bile acid:sodium symporter family protein [Sphaerochaetaceae bacterium]
MFHFKAITPKMKTLNYTIERFMPIVTPSGVILGLLLGSRISWMKSSVTWLFGFLTFCGALGIGIKDVRKTLKRPKFVLVFLLSANVILPCIAWMISSLCFPTQKDLVSGYMLLKATPTAVVGSIWSNIYGGNGAISLTVLLLDTLLAPLLTPLTMKIFTHTSVAIDSLGMMRSMTLMVVIPSLLGILINQVSKGKVNRNITPCLKPFSKAALLLVIIINTSQIADQLIRNASWNYIPIALVCAILAAVGFPISYGICRLSKLDKESSISITFASSLRNISAALVLAIDYFTPQAALPVIFGIVFQQSICAIMGHFLFRNNKIKIVKGASV